MIGITIFDMGNLGQDIQVVFRARIVQSLP